MTYKLKITQINALQAIAIEKAALRRIDDRLVEHCERVAFIASKLCEVAKFDLDPKILFLLCAFHDIGAYKTDEIDKMVEFETKDVLSHSIYGYLFVKYLTPLKDYAEAILYHHSSQIKTNKSDLQYGDYASLIHLADSIDVAYTSQSNEGKLENLFLRSGHHFPKHYVTVANQCLKDGSLIPALKDGFYHEENTKLCSGFITSTEEALDYLNMVVYSIDFRSECTVTHTITTISLAVYISRHYKLPEEEVENIYLGALLHDIGKLGIPTSILEHPGKLSDEQMAIMRSHVEQTEKIIQGIIPSHICNLALRHHEKLDGSGYPNGLTYKDLSFSQRIIAVADIVSTLSGSRSYKEPFPKEKTIAILRQMSQTKLDKDICDYVCANYDKILAETEPDRLKIIDTYKQITSEFKTLQAEWGF